MRKKFRIFYSQNHPDKNKAGKQYRPSSNIMPVMNAEGIFFLVDWEDPYYTSVIPLVDKIGNYDIKWSE